jgi:chromosome segregation ATPase
MRSWITRITALSTIAVLFSACGDDGAPVREEIAEAATAVKNYAFEQKDAFVRTLDDAGDDLGRRIDSLESTARDATAEARRDLEPTLATLREKRVALERRLAEARDATAEAWESARDRAREAYDDLEDAIEDAYEDLKD